MIGQKIGHYHIVEKIGAGGMGEVYRAHDTRLGRDVAIKVLPEAFAGDPERMARFEREAHLLASLNHPHIAAIYGLEEAEGTRYLVLELVEGETLAERLAAGRVALEEALPIANQIAEALEAAHEKGIVHRDLKPANIKITPERKVKILDFGLAKALEGERTQAEREHSPTISELATRTGVILGTAAYMPPEQVRGGKVDTRADIWAFGCVLFEMLSGKRVFHSPTAQDTLAAVLRTEPDWDSLPAHTPAPVRRLLRRCLEKDPKRRLQAIGDARIELEEALAGAAEESVSEAKVVRPVAPIWRRLLPWAVGGLLLLATIVANWQLQRATRRIAGSVVRVVVPLAAAEPLAVDTPHPSVAVSPDGTRLVYVANRGGKWQLYLRDLDKSEAAPIPGTEGGYSPFFSPDGRWVGFFEAYRLKKVSLAGGAPVALGYTSPVTRGASWGPNDTIIFTSDTNGGLVQIPAGGGQKQDITHPNPSKGECSHRWPEFLPGGKAVLLAIDTCGSFDDARIAVLDLQTGKRKVLLEGGTNARYARSGHLVFVRAGKLLAVPFDLNRLEVTGEPVTVVDSVLTEGSGSAHFSLSADGTLVYVPGGVLVGTDLKLVWVSRRGEAEPLLAPPRPYMYPSLSPDGQQVAVALPEGSNWDIWLSDVSRGTLTRLTFDPGEDFAPIWNPDGKRVTFSSEIANTGPSLFRTLADGSGKPEKLDKSGDPWLVQTAGSYSPDGRMLAFTSFNQATDLESQRDLWVLPGQGEAKPLPFLVTRFEEHSPMFSPDGRWLAYVSDESGREEVYVVPYPGPGGKRQVSTNGGTEPVWSPSGRELFYRDGDKMMAVAISLQPTSTAGKPQLLFEKRFEVTHRPDSPRDYDISRDGQRFLMLKNEQEVAPTEIHLVLNWFEELKRRAPPSKK